MSKSSRKKKKTDHIVIADKTSESLGIPDDRQLSGERLIQETRNSNYLLAGVVSFMTFLVYLPSLRNEFLAWDDGGYVTDNPMIRSIDLDFIKSVFFEFHASNWHPLTWISHAMDYAVWGLNPVGHHLTNIILHAAITATVVMISVRLIELYRARAVTEEAVPWLKGQGILIAGGVTGLLFGLHPVHVESVAWVAERKDLLCALFFLMSILEYLKYVNDESHKTAHNKTRLGHFNVSYLLCLGFFVLALLSKPMAVSLPFVLMIIDWYPSNRIHSMRSFRAVLIEKLPFILLSLGSSVLTILAQKEGGAMEILKAVPIQSRLVVAAYSLFAYLLNIMWPLNLSPFYPYPDNISLLSLKYFSVIVLAVGITVACTTYAKKQRLFLSVWGYYVVTLIPVLGVVQVGLQSMADRYTYLPSFSLFFLIGLLVAQIWGKIVSKNGTSFAKAIGVTAVALALITLGYLTVRQMRLWQNDLGLWSHAINVEKSDMAYWNRGIAFSRIGQFDKAIEDYSAVISLNHNFYGAYLNRGMAYSEMGLFDKAIADFNEAIAINPRYYEAYNNQGMVYGKAALFDKAIEQFNKAIDINPHQPRPYCNRGIAYYLIGENDRALKDLNRAIDLDGNYTEAYGARGNLFRRMGNTELAISDFKKACNSGDREGCRVLQTLTRR